MTQPSKDEIQSAKEAAALDADGDTEDKLNLLASIQNRRRKDPELEARYEKLRNELTRQIGEEGARWFETDDGEKKLAFVVKPETTTLDVEEAIALQESGDLDIEVLDLIAPRAQNLEGIRQAITKKKLTPAQVRALLSFKPGTAYVKYADPLGRDSE